MNGVAATLGCLAALATPLLAQPPQGDGADLARDLLRRQHGPLAGTFSTAILELRETPKASLLRIVLSLPDKMRVDYSDESKVDLWVKGVGWRCSRGRAAVRLAGEDLAQLDRLRQHLRGLLLRPLSDASHIVVGETHTLECAFAGSTWVVTLDAGDRRVTAIDGPAGSARIEDWLDTGITLLPKRVVLEGIGDRQIAFVTSGLYLDPALFEDPFLPVDESSRPPMKSQRRVVASGSDLPPEPQVQELARRSFLVVHDPGDWQQRCALLLERGTALAARGQLPDGLPTYRADNEPPSILIPFRPNPTEGNPPFARGRDEEVLHLAAGRFVVAAPAAGTWDQVVARGRELVTDFARKQELEFVGPLYVIPFVEPVTPPTEKELARLRVRVEIAVR